MSNEKIIVATSIAPRNIENQKKAIDSWIEAGLDVISFNCLEEYEAISNHFPNIQFNIVQRDGRNRFGKPYIFLDDIMEYFKDCDYDVCGIINSDIHLLGVDGGFGKYIYDEAKNSFVYGNRVEIKSLDNLNGMFYVGHDYFFFDKQISYIYPREDFWIGQPAWDYWIVFMPIISGFKVKKIINAIAYHIIHTIQWDNNLNIELHKMIVDKYFDKADKIMKYKSASSLERFYELILNYYQPVVYTKRFTRNYSVLIVCSSDSICEDNKSDKYSCILNQTYKNIRICYGNNDSINLNEVKEDLIFFMGEDTVLDNWFFEIMVNHIENKDMCICNISMESKDFSYVKDISVFDMDSGEFVTDALIDECILYNTEFYKKRRPMKSDLKKYNFALVPNGLVKKEFISYLNNKLNGLKDKRVYIYAAGGHTKKLLNRINLNNIYGIFDSNPELDGTMLQGIPVYSKGKINQFEFDYIVISSMSYEEEIYNELKYIIDKRKLIRIYNY